MGGTEVVASVSITLVSFVSDLGLGSSCGTPPDDVVEFKAAEEAGDPGNVINEEVNERRGDGRLEVDGLLGAVPVGRSDGNK